MNVAVLVPHDPVVKFGGAIFGHGVIVAALGAAQGREVRRNSGKPTEITDMECKVTIMVVGTSLRVSQRSKFVIPVHPGHNRPCSMTEESG